MQRSQKMPFFSRKIEMIDIPIGKALVAVENLNPENCQGCALCPMNNCSKHICCTKERRKDKKRRDISACRLSAKRKRRMGSIRITLKKVVEPSLIELHGGCLNGCWVCNWNKEKCRLENDCAPVFNGTDCMMKDVCNPKRAKCPLMKKQPELF